MRREVATPFLSDDGFCKNKELFNGGEEAAAPPTTSLLPLDVSALPCGPWQIIILTFIKQMSNNTEEKRWHTTILGEKALFASNIKENNAPFEDFWRCSLDETADH